MNWKERIDAVYNEHVFNIHQAKETDMLYHYTSPNGLMGIIDTTSLWFSDSDFLNDESESYYFRDLFNDLDETNFINIDNKKRESFARKAWIIAGFHSVSLGYNRMMLDKTREYRFVLSLSLDADNISLWNYYTKNPGNVGYCIGFNGHQLLESIGADYRLFHGKVIYGKRKQKQLIRKLMTDYWNIYSELKYKYQREYLFSRMEQNIVLYSIFMKNSAFACENEYRIAIMTTDAQLLSRRKFREVKGAFVPYLSCSFDKNSIKTIGISPTHKGIFVKKSLQEYSDFNDINVEIYNSEIPLRY